MIYARKLACMWSKNILIESACDINLRQFPLRCKTQFTHTQNRTAKKTIASTNCFLSLGRHARTVSAYCTHMFGHTAPECIRSRVDNCFPIRMGQHSHLESHVFSTRRSYFCRRRRRRCQTLFACGGQFAATQILHSSTACGLKCACCI